MKISINIDDDLIREIDLLAELEVRNRSQQIIFMLKEYIKIKKEAE